MKKIITLFLAAMTALSISAQMRVWVNGQISYEKNLSEIDSVTFVDPTEKPGSEYTSIKFKEAAIQVGIGEGAKLVVLYEPTTLEAPNCTWASSDTTIVAVDQNGNVTGLAKGLANVTAKVGELEAVCQVEVLDPLQMIEWGGFALFGLDKETILSEDTVKLTLSSGTPVSCVMIPATYYIWDTNIFLDASGYLNGAGYIMIAEGTALLITDDLGKGPNYHYLGTNSLQLVNPVTFNPKDTAFAYCAPAGMLGDAAQHMAWLEDTTGLVEPAYYGTMVDVVDFNTGKYLSMFAGYAAEGIFVGDENAVEYRAGVNWFEDESAYGLKLVETAEGYDFKQPYEWAQTDLIIYEMINEESAPKYEAKKFVAPKQDLRTIKRVMPTDVLIKK